MSSKLLWEKVRLVIMKLEMLWMLNMLKFFWEMEDVKLLLYILILLSITLSIFYISNKFYLTITLQFSKVIFSITNSSIYENFMLMLSILWFKGHRIIFLRYIFRIFFNWIAVLGMELSILKWDIDNSWSGVSVSKNLESNKMYLSLIYWVFLL